MEIFSSEKFDDFLRIFNNFAFVWFGIQIGRSIFLIVYYSAGSYKVMARSY